MLKETTKKAINKQGTVLIIEDDLFLIKAYQIKFAKEGFEVWTAKDGREALAFLEKEAVPAVVLLDLMLPIVSGFEVLAAIRNNPDWKNTPVIVLSNLGQQQDIDKCKALGANEYLIKSNTKINEITEKIKGYFK